MDEDEADNVRIVLGALWLLLHEGWRSPTSALMLTATTRCGWAWTS